MMNCGPGRGQTGGAGDIDYGAASPHITLGLSSCLKDPYPLKLSNQTSSAKELVILHSYTNILILPLICIFKAFFFSFCLTWV